MWKVKISKIHNKGIFASKDIPKETNIIEYLEYIDTFIIGQISNPGHLNTMLNDVSKDTFKIPHSPILRLHDKCNELDGFTVAALAEQSQAVSHELKGVLGLLCGASERMSSVPIAVL